MVDNDNWARVLLHSYFAIHQVSLCGRVLASLYQSIKGCKLRNLMVPVISGKSEID